MKRSFWWVKLLIICSLAIFLSNCQANSNQEEEQTSSNIQETEEITTSKSPEIKEETTSKFEVREETKDINLKQGEPIKIAPGKVVVKTEKLEPGPYCFNYEDNSLSAKAQLLVSSDQGVNGTIEGVIQNDEQAYYTSYIQSFSGALEEQQLDVSITTKIEDDVQKSQEIWTLTEKNLTTNKETFTTVDCSTFIPTEPKPETQTEIESPAPIRVKFAPGTSSTVLDNSVVRGSRDIYLLGAKGGQTMNLSITSLEDNAVFDLVAPDGKTIIQEKTNESIVLPETGDYQVIVGGTRGNATYQLQVEIK